MPNAVYPLFWEVGFLCRGHALSPTCLSHLLREIKSSECGDKLWYVGRPLGRWGQAAGPARTSQLWQCLCPCSRVSAAQHGLGMFSQRGNDINLLFAFQLCFCGHPGYLHVLTHTNAKILQLVGPERRI